MRKYAAAAFMVALAGRAAAGQPISVAEAPQVVRDAIAQGQLSCERQATMNTRLSGLTLCRFRRYPQASPLLLTDTGFTVYRPNEFYAATPVATQNPY